MLVENRRFHSTTPVFGATVGGAPLKFLQDLWHEKTRVPGLSYDTACVMTRIAVLIELATCVRWTDGRTDVAIDRLTD